MQSKAQSAPKTHPIWNVPLSRVGLNKVALFQKSFENRVSSVNTRPIRYRFRVATESYLVFKKYQIDSPIWIL